MATATPAQIEEWKVLFDKVNADADYPVDFSDTEFYEEQIWNLTNEGDLTWEECQYIAAELAKLESK